LWLQKCVCRSEHLWYSSSMCWVHWSWVFLVVMWRRYQLLIDHPTASPGTLIWGCISPKWVSRLLRLDSGLCTYVLFLSSLNPTSVCISIQCLLC
jgi:hypothetical protein